ncbi:hypothetical protein CSKR_111906, partial [Clonorchis sinensis]
MVRTRPLSLDFPCLGLGNLVVSQPSCSLWVAWQLRTGRVLQLNWVDFLRSFTNLISSVPYSRGYTSRAASHLEGTHVKCGPDIRNANGGCGLYHPFSQNISGNVETHAFFHCTYVRGERLCTSSFSAGYAKIKLGVRISGTQAWEEHPKLELLLTELYQTREIHSFANHFVFAGDSPGTQLNLS